jgi:hypothetical protein
VHLSGGVSRGSFLKCLAAAALAPLTQVSRVFAFDLVTGPASPAGSHAAAIFRDHLHSNFLLRSTNGASVALRLASVTEHARTGNFEQFSLTFSAPLAAGDLQGTQRLTHHVLGDVDMFIVPVGATGAGTPAYEACFSRAVSPS